MGLFERLFGRRQKRGEEAAVCAPQSSPPQASSPPVRQPPPQSPAERVQQFEEALKRFVNGKKHGFEIWRMAAELGELVVEPLRSRFTFDLNGPHGRAAAIACKRLPPELAVPLLSHALKSNNRAVRYFAIEYLVENRADMGARNLAKTHLQSESEQDLREMLTRATSEN